MLADSGPASTMPAEPAASVRAAVAELLARLNAARPYNIGFPGAVDFDYTALGELLGAHLLNNVGDPYIDGVAANHTKNFEREVVDFVADLVRAPVDDRWGYVASGGTESNLYGLWLGRTLYPDGVLYFSAAAHPSVAKNADILRMNTVVVRADVSGEMDYTDLAGLVAARRDRPAIVVATIGTTLSEAADDVGRICSTLDDLEVRRRFVHADAALSGIPLALLDPPQRPRFDLADGADSITASAHKFVGCPNPGAVLVTRKSLRDRLGAAVAYTGSADTTISGSRSGHTALMLWYAIRSHGVDGLRQRAEASRALAVYLHQRLVEIGWPATRNPHAFTVVLATPPEPVTAKWVLASHHGYSHIITMPGITIEQVDLFLADLVASRDVAVSSTAVPAQRRETALATASMNGRP